MACFWIQCDALVVVAFEKPVTRVRLGLKDAKLFARLAEWTVSVFGGMQAEPNPLKHLGQRQRVACTGNPIHSDFEAADL